MTWFHEIEKDTVGVLMGYEDDHPGTLYRVRFEDGEEVVVRYDTSYESENSGELDVEIGDPGYDEFYQVALEVVEVIHEGPRSANEGWLLPVDYRDFPVSIRDEAKGIAVFPSVP